MNRLRVDNSENVTAAIDTATFLAVERTRVAYERTMMAWIRTAISLITFGFAIYKLLDTEHREKTRFDGPRIFGIMMVSFGLLSLLLATIENRQYMRQLKVEYSTSHRSMARTLAFMVAVLGILALVVMLLRA